MALFRSQRLVPQTLDEINSFQSGLLKSTKTPNPNVGAYLGLAQSVGSLGSIINDSYQRSYSNQNNLGVATGERERQEDKQAAQSTGTAVSTVLSVLGSILMLL